MAIGDAVKAVEAAAAPIIGTGITASFSGAAQAFADAQAGLLILLVLAIAVIYIVLGILYESFIHPAHDPHRPALRRVRRAADAASSSGRT